MEQKEAIETIREFARQSLNQSGILEEQKDFIWGKVQELPDLMKSLARRAFDELAVGELYNYRNAIKREFIKNRETPNETKRSFAVMMASKSALDFFLCFNKPIGDCTRDDLLTAAAYHENRGAAEMERAAIFATVAKKVKPGETVRQCMNDDQFSRILSNVSKRKAG